MKVVVTAKYRMYQRANGVFYAEDMLTKKQASLHTRDRLEAERLLHAKNEAARDPLVSREVGMAYLSSADPEAKTRTWQWAMDQLIATKAGETQARWETARKDTAFDVIRTMVLVDTRAEHFLTVLNRGTVSTNVYLRRIHNFALDMGWLPRAVIVRRQWPKVKYKKKRAITLAEHQLIVKQESNAERRDFYELLWHTGGAQGDIAKLKAEDIDWETQTLRFFRRKTDQVALQRFGSEVIPVLKRRPQTGLLFAYLSRVKSKDRATEFHQRCELVGIKGVTLHSYRYSWAQRAKKCGFPERYAMLALGQNSKAVHAHYAGTSEVTIPSLAEYEYKQTAPNVIPLEQPISEKPLLEKQQATGT